MGYHINRYPLESKLLVFTVILLLSYISFFIYFLHNSKYFDWVFTHTKKNFVTQRTWQITEFSAKIN